MVTKKRSHRVTARIIFEDGTEAEALVPVDAVVVRMGSSLFKRDRRMSVVTFRWFTNERKPQRDE